MAKKPPPSLTEFVDSRVEFEERRGVCYQCGLAYNGIKKAAKCPKCARVIKTEAKSKACIITGTWIRLSDFRSDQHLG